MDDLEFRRRFFAEPNSRDPLLIDAKSETQARKNLSHDIDRLEQKINSALNVPVPDELFNKLMLRQTMESHKQETNKKRFQFSIAASVALILGLSVNSLMFSTAHSSWADYALAHTYHELDKFSNNAQEVISLSALNDKMISFSGTFSKAAGKLLSADYCRFDGMKSLHLVYQGKHSPINVYVVPENEDLAFNSTFSDERLHGQTIKYKGRNVIIVSEKGESLYGWQESLDSSILWSS